jgi:uncharacterized protein (TIGR03437 family)
MRLCKVLYLLAVIACSCLAATVESVDLSANFVFFERSTSQSDTETVYWIRGFNLGPRLIGDSFVLAPGLGSNPIRFRFSEGMPARREGTAARFTLNEFSGSSPSWRRGIGIWQSVQYQSVRPGVDLEFSARRDVRGVDMTARIAPGNQPEAHYLEVDANTRINLANDAANLTQGFGAIRLTAASAYQMQGGQKVAITAQFRVLSSGRLSIQPGEYNKTLPLYLTARLDLQPSGISSLRFTAAGNGSHYLAGTEESNTRCSTTTGGRVIWCTDVWVARFLASGEPVFLTRLAGTYHDQPYALSTADNGDLLVTGSSDSADFPATANAVQPVNAGPVGPRQIFAVPPLGDGFVSRIDGANGNLLYSTFYGLPNTAEAVSAVSAANQVLIAVNGESLALLDPSLGRTLARIETPVGYIFQGSLAENGEVTFWDSRAGALARLGPGLGERKYTFGLGFQDQSSLQNLLRLPNGNTLVAWSQGTSTNPDRVVYLSEIDAEGQRELWRTEVAPRATAVTSIVREASGDILLLLNTTMATVPTTEDAPLRATCAGAQTNSVVLQRYSASGDPLFSTYLPVEVRSLSVPATGGGQMLTGIDFASLAIHQIRFDKPTTPKLACVTGGATRVVATAIAPGQIITLLGAGFGSAGTSVYVNQVRAPLLYLSDGQINAIVPYEGVEPGEVATIEVRPAESAAMRLSSEVRAGAVEIFTLDASGSGSLAAFNQDGSLNSEQNPAAAGSIVVLYGTGIGRTLPASVTGGIAPVSGPGALARPLELVTARIGFAASEVLYAGAAPGLVNGAAQFNLRVPTGLPSGRWPVEIILGIARSSSGAGIWIR